MEVCELLGSRAGVGLDLLGSKAGVMVGAGAGAGLDSLATDRAVLGRIDAGVGLGVPLCRGSGRARLGGRGREMREETTRSRCALPGRVFCGSAGCTAASPNTELSNIPGLLRPELSSGQTGAGC